LHRRADSAFRFLAEANEVLASSLDFEETLQSVARIVVPALADWSAVHLATPGGTAELLTACHTDPAKEALVRELQRRYPAEPDASASATRVLRTGKTALVPEVDDDMLMAAARDRDHLRLLRALGLRSFVCAPLTARGRVIGTLSLASAESGRRYRVGDVALVEDLARRAALCVDNARLFHDAGEATHRLQEALAEAARAREELRAGAERHAAELEHRVAERTGDLNAFTWSISHDLRAPLRAVAGLADALAEDCGAQLDTRGLDYVDRMRTAALRMDAMIDALLQYCRLGHTEVRLEGIDLGAAVARVLADLRAELDERDALVTVLAPLPQVRAFVPVLEQVLANLLSNAVKFVPPDTRPRIAVRAELPDPARVRLWIEDNGIGIEPHHQERVFHVFERLHGQEAYPGTGIGLAIVRRGMERLGGAAGVESRLAQGSRFWIELPVAPAESAA
jgi:signal transduction histidine kinase